MSTKLSRQPGNDQEAMFSLADIAPVPDEPGISVSLDDRAKYLANTLDLLGKVRMLDGLDEATEPGSAHLRDFDQRYGQNLTKVKRGALSRREEAMGAAHWQFAFAAGHIALKNSGQFGTVPELDAAIEKDFNDFEERYFT